MGQSLSGRIQKRNAVGVWEDMPVELDGTRHEHNVGWRQLLDGRVRGRLGYIQYQFLLTGVKDDDWGDDDTVPVFIQPRGLPDDFILLDHPDGYYDGPEYEGSGRTWFDIDEFLNFPFDEFYHCGFTARTIIGQPCIDYFQSLKDQGAERIVLWI